MRRQHWVILGVVSLAVLVAIVVVARPFTSGDDSPEWLFAHNSAEARFADDGGELTLTLVDPDPQILAFTDRPDRVATTLPLADLVGGWPQMFGTDAPNAAVSDARNSGGFLPLTLSGPRWAGEDLVFDARLLASDEQTGSPSSEPPMVPRTIVGATMLIDSATANDDNYTIDYSLDGDYARFNLGTEGQPELADAGCYAWLPQSPENCVQ